MDNFEICHHCKLLYPENLLLKCEYNSEKFGAPLLPVTYYDHYLAQVSKRKQFHKIE